MQIEELQKQLETEKNADFRGNCHDCGVPVEVLCNTEQPFFKCDKCFQKDRVLHNWRPIETYSRVVGYIRPVQQWNKGKREEYKQRKEFVVEG